MSFDIGNFVLRDRLSCSAGLARATQGAASLSDAADAAVRYLHDHAIMPRTGERACVAVRFYLTHADGSIDNGGVGKSRQITRLASAGVAAIEKGLERLEPVRTQTLGDPRFALENPLLAHLCAQLGVDAGTYPFFSPDVQRTPDARTYAVFHVREVTESPYVAGIEQLLVPHGLVSVLAIGGKLSRGDVVAVVLYSRSAIPDESAEQFRTVALDLTALFRSHEGRGLAR